MEGYFIATIVKPKILLILILYKIERTIRMIKREEALALVKKYNEEPFHMQHAYTVEGVMRYFAQELGYEEEVDF